MVSLYREVVTEVSPEGGVVVGDDGSPGAEAALRYALDEARRRNADLHVIRAWRIADAMTPDASSAGYVPSLTELEANTLQDLRGRVHRVLGEPEDVEVHLHAVYASRRPRPHHCIRVRRGRRGRLPWPRWICFPPTRLGSRPVHETLRQSGHSGPPTSACLRASRRSLHVVVRRNSRGERQLGGG